MKDFILILLLLVLHVLIRMLLKQNMIDIQKVFYRFDHCSMIKIVKLLKTKECLYE